MKMTLIGLGKREGAFLYHRAAMDHGFDHIVRGVIGGVVAKCSIVAGVGIVENGIGETARIEAVPSRDFQERERVLLDEARGWTPKLPFESVDVLLIDEVGKNIAGTGFDLTAVGRTRRAHEADDDEYPKVRLIALRDLTAESFGNAEGMGLAEFCRTRLIDKVDQNITRINTMTSGHVAGAMTPIDYATDQEMLEAMLVQIGMTQPPDAKLVWIHNTKALADLECSAAYLNEARERDDLEILSDLRPLPFDTEGNLPDGQLSDVRS